MPLLEPVSEVVESNKSVDLDDDQDDYQYAEKIRLAEVRINLFIIDARLLLRLVCPCLLLSYWLV